MLHDAIYQSAQLLRLYNIMLVDQRIWSTWLVSFKKNKTQISNTTPLIEHVQMTFKCKKFLGSSRPAPHNDFDVETDLRLAAALVFTVQVSCHLGNKHKELFRVLKQWHRKAAADKKVSAEGKGKIKNPWQCGQAPNRKGLSLVRRVYKQTRVGSAGCYNGSGHYCMSMYLR